MLALIAFWAVAVSPGLLVRRFVVMALGHEPQSSRLDAFALTLLSLALGTAVFLVAFALLAMAVESHFVAAGATFVGLAGARLWVWRRARTVRSGGREGAEAGESTPLSLGHEVLAASAAVATVLLANLCFLWPRRFFSDVQFNPGALGGEKLFNMHFLSSFLHGSGFPPEDVWLAHEAVTYYVLPKALPGVVARAWQTLSGGENVAASFFHFGDTWFLALGFGAALAAGLLLPQRVMPTISLRARILSAAAVALLPWLSAPARGLQQLREGRFELWPLSRIIPNTVNEYPLWNWVWADNHAHSAVIFMQVSHVVLFGFLVTEQARLRPGLVFLLGLLSAAILQSHGMSVFVLCAFYAAFTLHLVGNTEARTWRVPLWNLLATVGWCLALTVPFFTRMPTASLKTYAVPSDIASKLGDFANVHFTLFVFLGGLTALCVAGCLRSKTRMGIPRTTLIGILAYGATGGALFAIGYTSAAAVFVVFGGLLWLIEKEDAPAREKVLRGSLLAGAAALYVVPEFFAMNWDMGRDYMRYNTIFRFQFETFHLVPLALMAAFAPSRWWMAVPRPLRVVGVLAAVGSAGVLVFVQKGTAALRTRERAHAPTVDGARYLVEQNPSDAKLIEVLSGLEGRVVLAEECGVHPKVGAYGEFGRLSAFSGRTALCGWGGHTYLFHNVMTSHGPDKGRSTWEVLLEREKAMKDVYASARTGSPLSAPTRELLRKWKVTHFAFGRLEEKENEGVTLDALARTVGAIVWREGPHGLVALDDPRTPPGSNP